MTPAEAREIDKLEFEAECAAIRQRAYALVQHKPVTTSAPQRRRASQAKRLSNPNGRPAQRFTVAGISLPISAWATRVGMTAHALHQRLRKGWTIEQAVSTPSGHRLPKDTGPGVVINFPAPAGTGAGSTAQETPEITFSEEANS